MLSHADARCGGFAGQQVAYRIPCGSDSYFSADFYRGFDVFEFGFRAVRAFSRRAAAKIFAFGNVFKHFVNVFAAYFGNKSFGFARFFVYSVRAG